MGAEITLGDIPLKSIIMTMLARRIAGGFVSAPCPIGHSRAGASRVWRERGSGPPGSRGLAALILWPSVLGHVGLAGHQPGNRLLPGKTHVLCFQDTAEIHRGIIRHIEAIWLPKQAFKFDSARRGPRNVCYLKAHLQLNRLSNVNVIEAAVSDCMGEASFDGGANDSMGHLADRGMLRVKVVALDELVSARDVAIPSCIKIDVEGAEARVLNGAKGLLSNLHPTVFGKHSRRECCQFLSSLPYELKPIVGRNVDETDEIMAFRPGC
ncbi:MAG: hypothetical protein DMG38_04260 [Acidobacteria bacterium]|nr:MAG: hypothetical protein DMG38_04260 [Acidobacteriota bacterium]